MSRLLAWLPTLARHLDPQALIKHYKSLKMDGSWNDCGMNMPFTGRTHFFKEVLAALEDKLMSPPTSPVEQHNLSQSSNDSSSASESGVPQPIAGSTPTFTLPQGIASTSDAAYQPRINEKLARALVFSSPRGTGKTVSMLQLKAKLPKVVNELPVVVSYLGFSSGLELLPEEKDYIANARHGEVELAKVLARRLVGSTILSMNNPEVIDKLPMAEQLYGGLEIPTVKQSKELLLQFLGEKTHFIVVCVDEVQMLNDIEICRSHSGAGRMALRILRQWQWQWFGEIRILPVATGIAVDWAADPTTGSNLALSGKDTTLMSKDDFRCLTERTVLSLKDDEFNAMFSVDTSKDTIVDIVAASYWPRVRLLEWWSNDSTRKRIGEPEEDFNCASWPDWFCGWLRGDTFSTKQKDLEPGKGDVSGKIHCLFELVGSSAQKFSVVPDGYNSEVMITKLSEAFPVPLLYEGLDVIKSMQPTDFLLRDDSSFEDLGFYVVGASIHIGLHALKIGPIVPTKANQAHKKRLGLALWLHRQSASTNDQRGEVLVPQISGRVASTASVGDFHPFKSVEQNLFTDDVVKLLKKMKANHKPMYIRCGRRTCCDYLYFYTVDRGTFLGYICDAKHTSNDKGCGGESVTKKDQIGLFKATLKVHAAFSGADLVLRNARLLFVTNRKALANSTSNDLEKAKDAAQGLFPNAKAELLNESTFDFGPLSDILASRRQKRTSKRKVDELANGTN